MEVDDLDDARKIREELKINSDEIKIPAYKLSEKWVWLWKIWLAIMVLIFLSEIIDFIPRIIEHG